ncbi:MAG TPA: YhjD/YihY/BrkB family envelope integrity protein [Anaeromyxobacter sp.]
MAKRGPAGVASGLARGLRTATSAVEAALRALEGESVRLRAMALTYISLFALVPALVVAFSVVQAFTGMERIATRVNEFLFENLAVGARATIEPYLQRFVHNAHLTSAGVVGGALLVWSAVSLFSNVDRAVNDIWGIRRRRRLRAQAIIYWVGLTLGPLLLAASVMLSHSTRAFLAGTGYRVLAALASGLLTCAFFAVLYLIVPDTKVRLGAAAAGGLAAGIAWELAKWGYTFAVAKFFRYHAIYGSVAAVPIFLLWLFVSWSILLFGARLAFVVQYAPLRRGAHPASRAGREILAGEVMLAVARAYDRGARPPDAGDLTAALGVEGEDASQAVAALKQASLIVGVGDGGLVPSRPLEKITLEHVRKAVEGSLPSAAAGSSLVARAVAGVEEEGLRRLAQVTYRDLCDSERPLEKTVPAAPDAGEQAPARHAPSA